jgi:hypothetical protein
MIIPNESDNTREYVEVQINGKKLMRSSSRSFDD